jgi:hypothetical protein
LQLQADLFPVAFDVAAEAPVSDDEKANVIASGFIASAVEVHVAADAPEINVVAQHVANVTPVDVAVVAAPALALAAAVPSVDVSVADAATFPVESAHADCDPLPPGQVTVATTILNILRMSGA